MRPPARAVHLTGSRLTNRRVRIVASTYALPHVGRNAARTAVNAALYFVASKNLRRHNVEDYCDMQTKPTPCAEVRVPFLRDRT